MMTLPRLVLACAVLGTSVACGGTEDAPPATATATASATADAGGRPAAPADSAPAQAAGFVEGKDYVLLERVRIIDPAGFDRPVEAMSVLLPKGWRTDTTVKWRSVNACRPDIVTWHLTSTSPDGAITLYVFPQATRVYASDPMILGAMRQGAQAGDCAVGTPVNATQRLQELAGLELGGATIGDVRPNEETMAAARKFDAQANEIARQYGNAQHRSSDAIRAALSWTDGTRGIATVFVSLVITQNVNGFGAPVQTTTNTALSQTAVRFAPERQEEAVQIFEMMRASHRINPVWTNAKDQFLTELGNKEHEFRLGTIHLMGEQARAYADEQARQSDARMRDWERRQASSDAQQQRTIQAIREVETWKTADGQPVELSAGYHHAWSRPDGSYILTNNSLFDPAVAFQQNWTRMEKSGR